MPARARCIDDVDELPTGSRFVANSLRSASACSWLTPFATIGPMSTESLSASAVPTTRKTWARDVFLKLTRRPELLNISHGSMRTYLITMTEGAAIDNIRTMWLSGTQKYAKHAD
jgi:hypothetical protein